MGPLTAISGVAARLRRCLLAALLAATAFPAGAADPFTLFVLRMLRDQLITSAIESAAAPSKQRPPKPGTAFVVTPPPTAEGQWLRGLIDDSFVHLSVQQRGELHASLEKMLNDPKNAPVRSEILGEFTRQAVAMRDAHRQLARLTEADMRLIAADARVEFERLPPEERRQMMQALQHGVPGIPRTLGDMMLAEFNTVTR